MKNILFDPLDADTWPNTLTVSQVSEILGISDQTLRGWDKKKRWVPIRLGKRGDRRYLKEDVIRVLTHGV